MTRLHVLTWVIAMVIVVSKAQQDDDYPEDIPPPKPTNKDAPCVNKTGFYPDPKQCDSYYECREGKIKYHLCEDGFVFVSFNPALQTCDYPFSVKCGDRVALQPAQPRDHCPRRNGLFPDPGDCGRYWQCLRGGATEQICQGSLAFNPKTGLCQWPADVKGCEGWTLAQRKRRTTPKPVAVDDFVYDDEVPEEEADYASPKPPGRTYSPLLDVPRRSKPTSVPTTTKEPTQAAVPSRVPAARATSAPSRSPQTEAPQRSTTQAPTRRITPRRPIPPRRGGLTTTTTTTTQAPTTSPEEEVEYYYDDEPAEPAPNN